ncbi:hypothetical protein H0H81_003288 [Sphagnurus paluster]|uniref:Uncharacterized protein n=1 Tax=Sphagnurus paluster TaxID=117069 RepID=A0A9P7FQ14_9AGAR|nr:hypothetical protein H0H81_003288 [Sphagnurus paluster]
MPSPTCRAQTFAINLLWITGDLVQLAEKKCISNRKQIHCKKNEKKRTQRKLAQEAESLNAQLQTEGPSGMAKTSTHPRKKVRLIVHPG